MSGDDITLTPDELRAAGVELSDLKKEGALLQREYEAILQELQAEASEGGHMMPLANILAAPMVEHLNSVGDALNVIAANIDTLGVALTREANAHDDADATSADDAGTIDV